VSWPNFIYTLSLFSQSFTYFHYCHKVLHIFTVLSKFYIYSLLSQSFTYFHFTLIYFHCFLKVLHIFTVFSKQKVEPWLFSSSLYGICLNSVWYLCAARIQMLGPLWRKHESVASSWSTLELQSIILDVPMSCNQSF